MQEEKKWLGEKKDIIESLHLKQNPDLDIKM